MDPINDPSTLTPPHRVAPVPALAQTIAWRIALFYGALFLVYGVNVTFMPVWFEARGLTPAEISIIIAAPFFVRCLVTPAVAAASDQRRNHRAVVIGLAWAALVLVLILERMQGFWYLLLPGVLLIVTVSTIMPLIETIAVAGVRNSGLDYGRMRLWGSLTFIIAGLGAGWAIDWQGITITVWLLAGGAAITIAAAYFLPADRPTVHNAHSHASLAGTDGARRGTRQLLGSPAFRIFLVATGAVQSAHALMLTLGAVHWQAQGYSGLWIGWFWLIAVTAEIGVFAYSRAIVMRFGAVELIYAAAIVSVVRWTVMAFDPPAAFIMALQALHGITYGAAHLGAIHFLRDAVPESHSGRGQALYATIAAGLAHGSAIVISGLLFERAGGLAYLAMAAIAILATVASARLIKTWDRGPLALH